MNSQVTLKPTGRRTPISLRIGKLESEVAKRQGPEQSAAAIIQRDIGRYYAVMRDSVRRLRFDRIDAQMLILALDCTEPETCSYRYLSAEVERFLDENRGRFAEWTEEGATDLLRRLKHLRPGDSMAILDAVHIFWACLVTDGWQGALIESGLTMDLQVQDDARSELDQAAQTTQSGIIPGRDDGPRRHVTQYSLPELG